MKFHHGEKVSLNCLNKVLSIYGERMLNENSKSNNIQPMSVAKAFVSDISLNYTNNDFHSIPELIGSGFFAKVFLIYNKGTNKPMAFKVPKPTECINRFFKEIQLLKNFHHENILKFYGTCLYYGVFGCLTEFLDSGNLASLIEKKGRILDWTTKVYIAGDVANGLAYLHNHFTLHRDLSAENILLNKLSPDKNVESNILYKAVIADFGLSLNLKNKTADRMSTVGNPFYTAPENLTNKSQYDYSSDVFSFGMILCEIITGLKNDPNKIPRTNNYGLDYKKLPIKNDCPLWIRNLACSCCMVCFTARPSMNDVYRDIEENKKYIRLWQKRKSNRKPYSDPIHSPPVSNVFRAISLSVSQQQQQSFHLTMKHISDDSIINSTNPSCSTLNSFRKLYRNNSVDSFIDPNLINLANADKDSGYVDKPLTTSLKSLDPRLQTKLSRCTSESGCLNLHSLKNSLSPNSLNTSKLFDFHSQLL